MPPQVMLGGATPVSTAEAFQGLCTFDTQETAVASGLDDQRLGSWLSRQLMLTVSCSDVITLKFLIFFFKACMFLSLVNTVAHAGGFQPHITCHSASTAPSPVQGKFSLPFPTSPGLLGPAGLLRPVTTPAVPAAGTWVWRRCREGQGWVCMLYSVPG